MQQQSTTIDSLGTEELLRVHNEQSENFNAIAESTTLSKPYQRLLSDISQADDHLEKSATAILARLLPNQEVSDEQLHVRRGAFAILKALQEETLSTEMSDIVTLRAILNQRRMLHERIPALIDEFDID